MSGDLETRKNVSLRRVSKSEVKNKSIHLGSPLTPLLEILIRVGQ